MPQRKHLMNCNVTLQLIFCQENWTSMTDEEKEQLTRKNNFFCGLHFLVGLADSAEEALKLWEAQCFSNLVASSGTQRLVHTACKAFHDRGSHAAEWMLSLLSSEFL